MRLRVVFDTNVVISAVLFRSGRLAWLRDHWRGDEVYPLLCRATAGELTRVLTNPKFRLDQKSRAELLAFYVPYCNLIEAVEPCPVRCRDAADLPFLDLAHSGGAGILVSGDDDLLSRAGKTRFAIESAESYRRRVRPERN